ncbi:hypothetical protein [Acetobacter persici]|uniref:hypothetical protein n=1 Tax=Acetobacter persici TaxID=1076596 RepID=UPI0039EA56F8
MRSLISEFSYGFALTHELVQAMGSLSAAPIFPSLIDEGAAGGGYDVKLEKPGLPVYIQFKRSECVTRKSGREIKNGADLSPPYYRFAVTASADSDQHDMLLGWDVAPNEVFYAAPMFHTKPEFDDAFMKGEVRQRSFFVRPRIIGSFGDDKTHHISFDGRKCYKMSEPAEIKALGVADLEQYFIDELKKNEQSLEKQLPDVLNSARSLRSAIRKREADEQEKDEVRQSQRSILTTTQVTRLAVTDGSKVSSEEQEISRADEFVRLQRAAIPPVPLPMAAVDDPKGQLAELADISIRDINAQLYIIQTRE